MYCHLCRADGSSSHENSAGHRAAKELASIAVDRLSDYLTATIDDDPSTPGIVNEDDFLKVKLPKTPAADETSKTQVLFCASCNVTLPVAEMKSHQRQKEHTLALFNEQSLEELVRQYADQEHRGLMLEPMRGPQVSVDESEAAKTYTCHLCALEVPCVSKLFHEWGLRHLSCRTLAVAAAKRIRDQLRSADKSGDKSGDQSENKSEDKPENKSEDKPEGGSGDKSKDKLKISGKMLNKLLKLYTGKVVDEDVVEETDGEPEEPKATKSKRLTTKQYFEDILPYLSYVSAFHTVIVDNSEFITIKIGRDTLKIHVNNYNGINHYERHGMYYMNCILCDGFNNSVVYSSAGQGDRSHVMSLGHIKNLLAPIDNIHLIRKEFLRPPSGSIIRSARRYQIIGGHGSAPAKSSAKQTLPYHPLLEPFRRIFRPLCENLWIRPERRNFRHPIDDIHSACALCNVYVSRQCIDNHILRDPKHTIALTEALERGKTYKDSKKHLKIMVCKPNKTQSQPHKWNFGIPHPQRQNSSVLFGGQPCGFGGAQIPGHNVSTNLFRGCNNTACHSQIATMNGAQNKPSGGLFGVQNNSGSGMAFGSAQNTASFGSAQNSTAFGSAQNTATFGSAQNNGTTFGAQNNNVFGGALANQGFGGGLNNTASFGNAQNNAAPFGSAQNNTGFGGPQNNAPFGSAQNDAVPFGSAQNNTGFGGPQNNAPFGSAPNNGASFGSVQNSGASFESAQNNTGFGSAQNNTTFGSAQNNGASNNKILDARFREHSIFKTPNKNTNAAIQNNGVANAPTNVGGFISSAATKVVPELVANPGQPPKQKSNKNNLTSDLTKTQPDSSEKAEKSKSPSEQNVKFTFHSNDGSSAVNKNGDEVQPKNGNAAQDKPDVGNKQSNNNKRNLIHYSSSSSDSE